MCLNITCNPQYMQDMLVANCIIFFQLDTCKVNNIEYDVTVLTFSDMNISWHSPNIVRL